MLRAERRGDYGKRGVSLRSVGTAGLRHVRPPAAALAAEHFGRLAHEIDGVKAGDEIVGDTDDDTGLAVVGNADDGDDAGADFLLTLVSEAAQVLQIDAFDRA